ncbi:MAG: outer membrane lipoprotein-sorting protein [Steroidobacter sp.]|nr:outer membrane lipoprotein-sorting protein [Steroidobacter sp.]
MRTVAGRAEGQSADRVAHIELIDKNGGVRLQIARAVRKNFDEGRRMAVFYQAPANIRGTSFLVYDYADESKQSDQWLYLPALRKVRRVPAADRGDYILGTDLTYDEIRNDNRVTLEDWRFVGLSTADLDGVACVIVDADASSDQVARELGYGRARWWVDPHVQMARRIEYWDRSGARLKTVDNLDVANVDGVWMARQVEAINHKTGHRTRIRFDSARFNVELPDGLFTQQQMERGP